jgi:hypothetical protein
LSNAGTDVLEMDSQNGRCQLFQVVTRVEEAVTLASLRIWQRLFKGTVSDMALEANCTIRSWLCNGVISPN